MKVFVIVVALVAVAVVLMMANMYRMVQEHAWTCVHCGMTSYHPKDLEFRYCGNCHHYCEEVGDGHGAWPPPAAPPKPVDVVGYRSRSPYR